jgi:hypothetical protein
VKGAVKSGAQDAATAVRKAKVPLAASAAAVAGVAGAMALNRNGRRRKVLGVQMPKRSPLEMSRSRISKLHMPKANGMKGDARKMADALTDAAQRADHFGQRVSSVASSVQKVSETASDAAKKA